MAKRKPPARTPWTLRDSRGRPVPKGGTLYAPGEPEAVYAATGKIGGVATRVEYDGGYVLIYQHPAYTFQGIQTKDGWPLSRKVLTQEQVKAAGWLRSARPRPVKGARR